MSDRSDRSSISLFKALGNFRIASEDADVNEEAAALIAVEVIFIAFPGATLLREIIENSFPRASRPAVDDDAALSEWLSSSQADKD